MKSLLTKTKKRGVSPYFPFVLVCAFLGVVFFRYRFDNSLFLIIDYLEGVSISNTGAFLSGGGLSFFTHSIGVARMGFPSLILSLLLWTHLPADTILFIVNFVLMSFSTLLLFKIIAQHTKVTHLTLFATIALISPVVFTFLSASLEISFVCFFFMIYVSTKNKPIQFIALVCTLFSSVIAIPLLMMTIVTQFFLTRNKKILIVYAMFVLVWSAFFVLKNGTSTVFYYFPILNPETHGFYIQTHRQADLALGAPIFGKIFYNKYAFIGRSVIEEAFRTFEWDYWVFHTATGKYVSYIPTYAFVSIFELPFVIYGLFYALKKKAFFVFLPFPILISMALYRDGHSIELLFYFVLMFLFICGFGEWRKHTKKIVSLSVLVLIVVSRLIIVNLALYSIKVKDTTFKAYSELSEYLTSNNASDVIITDRLGQPHIYLAYNGVFGVNALQNMMKNSSRRDAFGYIQPDSIDNFVFKSFRYGENEEIDGESLQYGLVEYEENIPGKVKKEAGIYTQFMTEVPYNKTTTHLIFVQR